LEESPPLDSIGIPGSFQVLSCEVVLDFRVHLLLRCFNLLHRIHSLNVLRIDLFSLPLLGPYPLLLVLLGLLGCIHLLHAAGVRHSRHGRRLRDCQIRPGCNTLAVPDDQRRDAGGCTFRRTGCRRLVAGKGGNVGARTRYRIWGRAACQGDRGEPPDGNRRPRDLDLKGHRPGRGCSCCEDEKKGYRP
jgi:hypothetical protein